MLGGRKRSEWRQDRVPAHTRVLFLYSFINLLWSKVEGNVIDKKIVIFMELAAINYKNK